MSAAAEALVLTRREQLPDERTLLGALARTGADLVWDTFEPDELGGYLLPPGNPEAQASLAVTVDPLGPAERDDLHRGAAAELGEERARPLADADVLVRISATAGPELDWLTGFEVLLGALGGIAGAITLLVGDDERFLDADEVRDRRADA